MGGSQNRFVEGTILSAPKAGMRVRVEDDSPVTGGFYIVFWDPEEPDVGGDYWVEKHEDVQPCLDELGWEVQWDSPLSTIGPPEIDEPAQNDD